MQRRRGVQADVVLTTYEMVQADRSTLSKVPWSCLVVDEAHRLKTAEDAQCATCTR